MPAGSVRALHEAAELLEQLHQLVPTLDVNVLGFDTERRMRQGLQHIAELSGSARVRATCGAATLAAVRAFTVPQRRERRDALETALLAVSVELENIRVTTD
jgi:hypothetical protein